MALTTRPSEHRVFVDADALFAGSASRSPDGASFVILRMAEITLVEAVTSQLAIVECERNLAAKLPAVLPAFHLIVQRCLSIVADPTPEEVARYAGLANAKDLPILVAAVQADCPWLVTFNVRHFQPGHSSVTVLRPGSFVLRVRQLLTGLTFDDA